MSVRKIKNVFYITRLGFNFFTKNHKTMVMMFIKRKSKILLILLFVIQFLMNNISKALYTI